MRTVLPVHMTITSACDSFLEHCRVSRELSPHTTRAYQGDLNEFQRFTGTQNPSIVTVEECDRELLRSFMRHLADARALAPATTKRRLACLRAFFKWLQFEGDLATSPFHRLDVRLPRPKRLPRHLSSAELAQLLRSATLQLGIPHDLDGPMPSFDDLGGRSFRVLTALVATEVLFATGLRVTELTDLGPDQVDLFTGTVVVRGKGARERQVFITDPKLRRLVLAYSKCAAQRAPEAARVSLLINSRGGRARPDFLRRVVGQIALSSGIGRRITPHMLRHSCATHLLRLGVDIRLIQALLGHQSIATTQIFTAVANETLRDAISACNPREAIMR